MPKKAERSLPLIRRYGMSLAEYYVIYSDDEIVCVAHVQHVAQSPREFMAETPRTLEVIAVEAIGP
jgi:hypothetical protein